MPRAEKEKTSLNLLKLQLAGRCDPISHPPQIKKPYKISSSPLFSYWIKVTH